MKIFFSLLVAIVSGLILGYVAAKIALGLQLLMLGVAFTFVYGMAGGAIGIRISDWTRNYTFGTICGLTLGLVAYYNYQIHIYRPIKLNPPADAPDLVQLTTSPEPQGFFRYIQLTALDDVGIFTSRRGRGNIPRFAAWGVEILNVVWIAIGTQNKLSND